MQPPPAQSRADSDDDEGAPVCSGTTSQKVGVARQYTEKYYDRVARDGRRFAKEHSIARQKKKSVADFHVFKLIGRGAFGEVRLCYRLDDPERTVLAMKILHKAAMIQRRQVDHVRAERDLLVEAKSRSLNEWSVELYYTFQDEENLYMVMEFCPGGDLMSWLIKYDIFPEDVARFYTAELVMAINALHKLGYAHRDVKPDNCLIDSRGHLKLTDFGLSKQAPPVASDETSGGQAGGSTAPLSSPPGGAGDAHDHHAAESAASRRAHWRQSRSRALFFSTVGSPGYIAPEVLARGGQGYGMECDWWGVGIILYEMLCGYPPFYDDDTVKVSHKIAHFNEYLEFPTGSEALGRHAVDLIKGLICEPSRRLQFAQIVTHPFFAGIDWTTLRMQKAPFEIALSSPTDTRYFDELEDNLPLPGAAHASQAPPSTDTKYLFYGFTSRFDKQGMSTRATTRREPRPGLPEFDDEDEEEGGR